jgi:hypothetical protein
VSDVTAVVQIGNSDDKLTQVEWYGFQRSTFAWVAQLATQIHFNGTSPGVSMYQNACLVFEIETTKLPALRASLADIADQYRQDSIALTLGPTEFVQTSA